MSTPYFMFSGWRQSRAYGSSERCSRNYERRSALRLMCGDSGRLMICCLTTGRRDMETLEQTLSERVDEVIRSHKGQLQSTTGPVSAIGELVNRGEGLEEALREIALEVQKLAASQKGGAPNAEPRASELEPLLAPSLIAARGR